MREINNIGESSNLVVSFVCELINNIFNTNQKFQPRGEKKTTSISHLQDNIYNIT